MDTRKFEYLETIRETIEQGDYEELHDIVEDIRETVKNDRDFEELFQEIGSRKYKDVIALIDDIIYKEMQAEFEDFDENGEDENPGPGASEFNLDFNFDEGITQQISFEPFDDEGYFEKPEEDNY